MLSIGSGPGSHRSGIFLAALPFTAFVTWLLAFPMKGFLLGQVAPDELFLWFLLFHIPSLFLLGRSAMARASGPWSSAACIGTAILTAAFPILPELSRPIMGGVGVLSSFVAFRGVLFLAESPRVAASAALGLAAANLLLLGLVALPVTGWTFILVSVPLGLLLFAPYLRAEDASSTLPLPYLAVLIVFNTVSGLMYGFMMPLYAQIPGVRGVELIFYLIGVAAAFALSRFRRELLLAAGVFLAMVAFSLLQGRGAYFVSGSMFAMQASAGFVDLFALLLILESGYDRVRNCGVTLSTICAGIAAGQLLTTVGGSVPTLLASGNAVLALSFLGSYLLMERQREAAATPVAQNTLPVASKTVADLERELSRENSPKGAKWKLTLQEKSVLELVISGMTYKEAALALGIAESSVKTYMKRIFVKADVTSKEALLGKLLPEPDES